MLHNMTRMMDSGGSTKRKKEQETTITAAEVVRQTNEAKPNVLPMGFPVITASGIREIKMPQTQLGLPLVEVRSGVPYAERRDTRWEDLFPQAVVPAQTVSVQEDPYAGTYTKRDPGHRWTKSGRVVWAFGCNGISRSNGSWRFCGQCVHCGVICIWLGGNCK